MAFRRFIESLRGTGRKDDISLKEKTGDIIRISPKAREELENRGRIVYVVLQKETLAELKNQTGTKSYFYGEEAREYETVPAMSGVEVAVIIHTEQLDETYRRSFTDQQAILKETNKPIDGVVFTHPQTPADALAIALSVYNQIGVNILKYFTRVGKYGSLVVGRLIPGVQVNVCSRFSPYDSNVSVGLLSLAVPQAALGS